MKCAELGIDYKRSTIGKGWFVCAHCDTSGRETIILQHLHSKHGIGNRQKQMRDNSAKKPQKKGGANKREEVLV